jgi:thiol:disulfide interchange protein
MSYTLNSIPPVFWLFLQSFIAGLLAVFTPYVYTIHPFTTGFLTRNVKTAKEKLTKSLIYAGILILFLTLLGILVSVIIKSTGLYRFTDNWIFNLFLFRVFAVLGISFLGAFTIKIPAGWINALAAKAKTNDLKGIFFMAITLPFASFSSTFPIMGLVLVLAWNISPTIGLFGFSIGLSLPFVFPAMHNIFAKRKSMLNNIKSIMGFLSLMLGLKFLSKADISLGYNFIDRELFIEIWLAIWAFMGIYMIGLIRFPNDTEPEQNIYGQEHVSLTRLFISIFAFVFALYLLPGIWGAPLHGVNSFLPSP